MSIFIANTWSEFKVLVDTFKLSIQYIENGDHYFIRARKNDFLFEFTVKITNPRNTIQIDFEDNYKVAGNKNNSFLGTVDINKGKLKVTLDTNYNTLFQEKTSVTTTATQLIFPEKGTSFLIIHRTPNGIMHIKSDNLVSSIDFKLKEDDILEIDGNIDFELWAIAESGTVDVFIMSIAKE